MIDTAALYRLVANLVDSASSIPLDAPDVSDNAHARALLRFAEDHYLDTQDIGTLFRVLAGEAPDVPLLAVGAPEPDRKSDR